MKYTCQTCHAVECGQTDYLSFLPSLKISSHKKQDFGGNYSILNCIGCHQDMAAHGGDGIISKQSCYKCHRSRKGSSLLIGYMHPKADHLKQPGIFAAAAIYQVVMIILIVVGFSCFIRFFGIKLSKEK